MARDETARERDSEQTLLGRAAHLQLADAAVATVADGTGSTPGDATATEAPAATAEATTEGDDGDE